MNVNEALIYLNAKSLDEVPSIIENECFQVKRFFFSNPFHPNLALSKIKKLKKILKIQNDILQCGKIDISNQMNENDFSVEGEDIIDCIQQYNFKKSQLFYAIHHTNEIFDLIFSIERLVKLFLSFGGKWPIFEIDRNELKLSKEMDPMLLLEQIKFLNNNGIFHFNELVLNKDLLSFDIKHESTRLKSITQEFKVSNPHFFSA
jgi:hypothetical protein